jgi:ATP-binding cassette subfamily B protein
MEGGLDAPITQGGTNVSGGQRQRLSIARALVRRPDVFVFDDASSALDTRTDAALRAALPAWTARSAVLLVGQRVASVRHADQILVLDGGVVVGAGTHEELLGSCPTYAEIVASQDTEQDAEHGAGDAVTAGAEDA